MTRQEWRAKRLAALAEYRAEVTAGTTTLNFETWRVQKGYVVTPQEPRP